MLKNKFLLLAVFCFVGVSFASENDQEESPTFFQKAKASLKSAASSPVAAGLFTLAAAPLIKKGLDISSSYIPKIDGMGSIVETFIRKDGSSLNKISFAIPTWKKVSIYSASGLAYYVSGKLFKDSDLNGIARLIAAVNCV